MKFKVIAEDVIGRSIFKHGYYEEEITNYAVQNISFSDGDMAIDIGANIGWYSLLFGKLAGPKCSVYAFEPDQLNFELLQVNIAANDVANVYSRNCAIAESSGKRQLYRHNSKNLGRHSLLPLTKSDVIEIEAVSLDEFFENLHGYATCNVRVMKIDIEGYEYFALSGATKTLARTRTIIMEFSPVDMKANGIEPSELVDLLAGMGFFPFLVVEGQLVALDIEFLKSKTEQVNLIWERIAEYG